ncbi:MAG: tellurite resistance TerB family protein [Desulfobulbus sp.]|nr:tellurite resistance TerB family protein [Desulfobulbus sp.]
MFLQDELQRPKSIKALTAGIDDPAAAKTMYTLAVAAITIDTEAERTWLDRLAEHLGFSREIQSFIEEQR